MGDGNEQEYSNKGVIIAVALVMMLGTLGVYAFGQILYAQEDDPYADDRHYSVEGTHLGEDVTGSALCVYVREGGDFHTYQMSIVLDDGTELGPVGIRFSASDDLPLASIYTSLGESEADGVPVTLWTMHDPKTGTDQTLAVSGNCTVVTLTLESDDMRLVCTLVPRDSGAGEE